MTALCALPELLKDERFPTDVKQRVERLLNNCSGSSIGKHKLDLNHLNFLIILNF